MFLQRKRTAGQDFSRPEAFAGLTEPPTPGQRRLFSACLAHARNDRKRAWRRLEAIADKPSRPLSEDQVDAALRANGARRFATGLLLALAVPGLALAFAMGYRLPSLAALAVAVLAVFVLRAWSRSTTARLPLDADEQRAFRARAATQPNSRMLLARWRREDRSFTQRDWLAVDAWVSACEEARRWEDVQLLANRPRRYGRGG